MKVIKQHGLERSGTNYCQYLLEENYHVKLDIRIQGLKHGTYDENCKDDVMLVIKNPYSWLSSMYRYRKWTSPAMTGEFEDFIQSPFYSFGLGKEVENPVLHWSGMYHHWLHFDVSKRKLCPVFYEHWLVDPVGMMKEIADFLKLDRKSEEFILPQKKMDIGAEVTKVTNVDFDSTYYTEHRYLEEFSKADLEFVKEHLDVALMGIFSYNLL